MPITGRPKKHVLVVTDDERIELERLAKRMRVNRAVAFRARLVLACAPGVTDTNVARRFRTTNATVGKWRPRFIARRLDGLYDEPRVGAPRTVTDADVEAVVVQTLETKPAGATHWSARTMAEKAGLSHTLVGRIWRTFGLKPHLTRSFKMSPDPQRQPEAVSLDQDRRRDALQAAPLRHAHVTGPRIMSGVSIEITDLGP